MLTTFNPAPRPPRAGIRAPHCRRGRLDAALLRDGCVARFVAGRGRPCQTVLPAVLEAPAPWQPMPTGRSQRGLTLIEMMITVGVLMIMMAFGVPSFQNMMNLSDRSFAMIEISAAVNRARSEAGRRAAAVSICASTDGATCRTDGVADWSRGWLVFADTNGDGRWQSTETMLAVTRINSSRITMTADSNVGTAFTVRADGFVVNPGTQQITSGCITYRDSLETRYVDILPLGRADIRS